VNKADGLAMTLFKKYPDYGANKDVGKPILIVGEIFKKSVV
jgi:hypothetical protein